MQKLVQAIMATLIILTIEIVSIAMYQLWGDKGITALILSSTLASMFLFLNLKTK